MKGTHNIFYSPLEQFEIALLYPMNLLGMDVSLTNSSLYILLAVFVCFLFFYFGLTPNPTLVPSRWQYLLEQSYIFVLDMVKQQAGFKALPYFPALLSIFLFIAISNLLGLTPFGFTSTSHIIVTFLFAFSFNLGIFFLGLQLHKLHFFSLFVPSGVPKALLPLIVVIEVISYLIRTFSLSLRLFANMMAGHTLLQILSSFAVAFWYLGGILALLTLFPLLLVFAVVVLEVGIALLQAYVFTILLAIYLNDSINLH